MIKEILKQTDMVVGIILILSGIGMSLGVVGQVISGTRGLFILRISRWEAGCYDAGGRGRVL
jgi:hypothetical protein